MKTKNGVIACLWLILFCILSSTSISLAGPEFNYQGRVTANGSNFNGTGFFKFILLNGFNNAEWSNDSVPASNGTNEPAGSISTFVNNGLFNFNVGNVPQGFTEIPPVLFYQGNLTLRIWFSTNDVTFEQFSPDGIILPDNFGNFDSGTLVIVDQAGTADLTDIQAAIDYAVSNGVTVLILPGFYEIGSPLSFSTNNFMLLQGVSRDQVTIVNTNGGAAALPNNVLIEEITLRGNPAVSDAGLPANYNMRLFRCRLERETAGGSTLDLSGDGNFEISDVEVINQQGGHAADLSGSLFFQARHAIFAARNTSGDGIVISDSANIVIDSCDIQSDNGNAISITASNGFGRITDSFIQYHVHFNGSGYGLDVNSCEISGSTNGMAAISVIDSSGFKRFVNCTIRGEDVPAVFCEASAENTSGIDLEQSRLNSFSTSGATNLPTMLITNAPGNDTESAEVSMVGSEINAQAGTGRGYSVSTAPLKPSVPG